MIDVLVEAHGPNLGARGRHGAPLGLGSPAMAGERIEIDGGRIGLVLGVGTDGRLHQLGLGDQQGRQPDPAFPVSLFPLALPTHGEEALRAPALRVTHADGSPSLRLVFVRATAQPHPFGQEHRIELVDRVGAFEVAVCFRTWPDHDLIEQWVEVRNGDDAPCTLHQVASASPALGAADPYLTHWGGGWANEWSETTERLVRGTKTVASAGGVRSSLHLAPVVLWSPDGRATETDGAVLAVSVAWGGDVRFDAEIGPHGQGRLVAGLQHLGAERRLEPGETFASPPAVLAWSDHGVGATSRALHCWVRDHVVRDGNRNRAIVFNNWEAMGFSLTTETVCEVIDGAADLGAELFLLDDGWFGDAFPRNDDTQGLGDWVVDARKFPGGLGPVVQHAIDRGIRFGLWVEPEMVNPRSEIYQAHPDWVIAEPGRERREERQQLVLDVCRPEVADFVLEVIDQTLALHPEISYLKWDANRDISESGSAVLPADQQLRLPVDRVRATLAIMDEVARRHPTIELMLCASGGGRSDLANLARFHELWTSDNTDPVDRVRIQWGASHLLPASVLGAHVTRWGQRPMPFACAVALSARFGFDIDPRSLTGEERETAAQAVATYRSIRALVQFGDLHRLVSPIGTGRGALAFLAPRVGEQRGTEGPIAVVFAFVLDNQEDHHAASDDGRESPVVSVPGLDPDRRYTVVDRTPGDVNHGQAFTALGRDLAATGLQWPGPGWPSAKVWVVSSHR